MSIKSNIHWTVYLIICTISVLLYSNTIFCGFVWDDRAAILNNKDVMDKDPSNRFGFIYHDFWGQNITNADSHKSYRPLTTFTYIIDNHVYGSSSMGYHMTNVSLYTLTSLVMLYFASLWLKPEGAFLASLLFVCHPVHVESVAGLVGRADCLCGLLFLLSLVCYTHFTYRDRAPAFSTNGNMRKSSSLIQFTAAHVLALFACFAKEIGVTVYGVLVVMECLVLHSVVFDRKAASKAYSVTLDALLSDVTVRQALPRIALCVVLVAAISISRLAINGSQTLYSWTVLENHVHLLPDIQSRVMTYAQTHFWYIAKLVYPRHLSFDYGFACLPTIHSIYDPRNLLPMLVYILFAALGVYSLVWQLVPSLVMGACLILLPLLPASNLLFPVGTLLAERLLFIPSIGFCLIMGRLLTEELVPYWQWVAQMTYVRISHIRRLYRHYASSSKSSIIVSATSTDNHAVIEKRPTDLTANTIIDSTDLHEVGEKYAGVALLLFWVLPVVLLSCARVWTRNSEWKNEEVLFASALQVCPLSVKALSNHGLTQLNVGRAHVGALAGETAAALYPQHTSALINAGISYSRNAQFVSSNYLAQTALPETYMTQRATTSSDKQQPPQQQPVAMEGSESSPTIKYSKNENQLVRSLYTFQRAMLASNYSSAKAFGYSGSTLNTYVQHLLGSNELTYSLTSGVRGDTETETEQIVRMLKSIAANQIETSIVLGLESPYLLHTLGSIYIDLGDSGAAAFYLRGALQISDTSHRTGMPSRGMGNSATAENIQRANTCNQLGNALNNLGQLDEALSAYRSGLQYDPSLVALYVNIGSLYSSANDPASARGWLLRGLQVELGAGDGTIDDDTYMDEEILDQSSGIHLSKSASPALLNNLGLAELSLNRRTHAAYYFEWAIKILSSNQQQSASGSSSYIWNTVQDNLRKVSVA